MKDSIYLVMNSNGVVKMTKKPPRLLGNERATKIDISVDDSIFEYTFMRTLLTIEEKDVIEPSLEVQVIHDMESKL